MSPSIATAFFLSFFDLVVLLRGGAASSSSGLLSVKRPGVPVGPACASLLDGKAFFDRGRGLLLDSLSPDDALLPPAAPDLVFGRLDAALDLELFGSDMR